MNRGWNAGESYTEPARRASPEADPYDPVGDELSFPQRELRSPTKRRTAFRMKRGSSRGPVVPGWNQLFLHAPSGAASRGRSGVAEETQYAVVQVRIAGRDDRAALETRLAFPGREPASGTFDDGHQRLHVPRP